MYLLIVTGFSGAGKSCALKSLEDMGFFCVDNMPTELVSSFISLCKGNMIENVALAIDSRASVISKKDVTDVLSSIDADHDILFLDCKDDILIRRYSETRRRHPMSVSVEEGIRLERALLQPLKECATYVIDTSELKPKELRLCIERMHMGKSTKITFTLVVTSFGFKRGVPSDADMVFDMRFLKNPFYEPELRPLSGMNQPVVDYIISDPSALSFINSVEQLLRLTIPKFKQNDKHRLMVAFGCTGGRHRSVFAACTISERLKDMADVTLVHRDLSTEAKDIEARFKSDG